MSNQEHLDTQPKLPPLATIELEFEDTKIDLDDPSFDLEDTKIDLDDIDADQDMDCSEKGPDPGEDVDSNIGLATGGMDLDEVNDNLQLDVTDDNLSLEVNLGDGSSRRASDVSTLSFQNLGVEDTENTDPGTGATGSRRGSGESSSDSFQNEFPEADAQAFGGALEEKIAREKLKQKFERRQMDLSDRKSESEKEEGKEESKEEKNEKQEEEEEDEKEEKKPVSKDSEEEEGEAECGDLETGHVETSACADEESIDQELNESRAESEHAPAESEASQPSCVLGSSADDSESSSSAAAAAAAAAATPPATASEQQQQQQQAEKSEINNQVSMEYNKKRNSLEIRNNIPDVNGLKSLNDDIVAEKNYHNQSNRGTGGGAVPKMRKRSPGVARRVKDESGSQSKDWDYRDTSSSEKEMEKSTESLPSPQEVQVGTTIENGITVPSPSHSSENRPNSQSSGDLQSSTGSVPVTPKKTDVENEYDYIKYARFHQGSSYVGMRLAYSSSNDSLNFKRNSWGVSSSGDVDSSREASPEKTFPPSHKGSYIDEKLNEDTLTEIPLNGNDVPPNGEENRNFSLSPEATDCDSAEVESVISEEGKSSSGMPNVEDGLSSSQCSDNDENYAHDSQAPAEILKRRYKAEIETQRLEGKQKVAMATQTGSPAHSASGSSDNSMDEFKRDALDLAMKDIKSAIERSRNTQLKAQTTGYKEASSPEEPQGEGDEEPVWIMR